MFFILHREYDDDENVWDMGSRESDVGEVQSEDGFTCRSSKIRSQIEPRQYHFIIDEPPPIGCFPTHPNSSDSLFKMFPIILINLVITNISLLDQS